MSYQRPYNIFGGGFGAVPNDDPIYTAGWTAVNRTLALPGIDTLAAQGTDAFNILNNLRNTLQAWADTGATTSQDGVAQWTTWLNSFSAAQESSAAAQRPSVVHPDFAAIVLNLYSRYLHRTAAQVDDAGLDFWTNNLANDGAPGPANAEHGFRVQAVNDGVYTEATLPAPLYFTLPATTGGDAGDNSDDSSGGDTTGTTGGTTTGTTNTGTTTGTTTTGTTGGVIAGVENAVAGIFDKLATATGISKSHLELGAVVVGVGALVYFNSQGGTTRKR
jgi:hypothetical protein